MKTLLTFLALPALLCVQAGTSAEASVRLLAQIEPRLKALYETNGSLGNRSDYFVYPNRDHGLAENRESLAHVRMLIARYLLEHLPAGLR